MVNCLIILFRRQSLSIFKFFEKLFRLEEKEACKFMHQLISGIEFLHLNGIAHRFEF